jgi:AcrR family transcriptional regulator
LRASLLELIGEVPYDTLTVDQIVDRADVGRATFYAHYVDKADLLRELTDELISEAATRAKMNDPAARSETYSGTAAAEIIAHAGEHPDLYRLVISGGGGVAPRRQLFDTLRNVADEIFGLVAKKVRATPPVEMHVTTTAFTGALLATIEEWLASDMSASATEVAAILMRSQVEGLRWALGLGDDVLLYEEPKSPPRG